MENRENDFHSEFSFDDLPEIDPALLPDEEVYTEPENPDAENLEDSYSKLFEDYYQSITDDPNYKIDVIDDEREAHDAAGETCEQNGTESSVSVSGNAADTDTLHTDTSADDISIPTSLKEPASSSVSDLIADSMAGSDEPANIESPEASDNDSKKKKKSKGKKKKVEEKHRNLKIVANTVLAFFAMLSILYLVFVYSENKYVVRVRNTYIQTAMSTLNHKWLAEALIPSDKIDDALILQYEYESSMVGVQSDWGALDTYELPSFDNAVVSSYESPAVEDSGRETTADGGAVDTTEQQVVLTAEQTFYKIYHEIDKSSFEAYVAEHPDVIANGWDQININEAGLDDSGTTIHTTSGDQVLAINVPQEIILIRVNLDGSRGVLAICKNTSKLSLCLASTLPDTGETAGRICYENNGILAMTASGFIDIDEVGNGGEICGVAVSNGSAYGDKYLGSYKRLELRNDNKMYIVDSSADIDPDTREAAEFVPALIVDGEIMVDSNCGWTGPHPRAVIGQTNALETMCLVVEGRFADSPGCSVVSIAQYLQEYGCVQAMNMDGGTSAIMYYDGEYVTRCSNTALESGRTLPDAWVYRKS